MKKLSLILIGLLLIPTLFLTSCDKGDDTLVVSVPAQKLMVDYMLANNLDINNILTSTDGVSFVAAPPADADLQTFLNKYYIIDIRSAADYATSHISGAKNVAFANILAEGTASGSKPVLVVCYTGQTACYATALLRMSGFKNTQALKWGMSGWNSANAGSWNNAIGNSANGHSNWSYDSAPTNMVFTKPVISSLSTDGATILKNRIELVISEGFKTAKGSDVLATPTNYFVNNFFSAADYSAFGHIKGAYRINPLTLADNSYLGLDPAAKVVTYCYTGQTSAVITACLRVLGYDAYSLSFGMNGMYNNNTAWTSNKWSSSVSKNLPVVQ
ncbi:MAG: rhodanese-like domain-containing protein [Lutibacter sp.]|nr:rhodanese-like domain-containing protein [Lutibacter sp.]